MAGRLDKPRVFVVGDLETADEELAHVNAVDRPLVFVGVRGAHQEVAGREYARDLVKMSALSLEGGQYSPVPDTSFARSSSVKWPP